MSDYGAFAVGGAVYPLALTANPILQDADPALNEAIGYLKGCLEIHLGARWNAAVAAAAVLGPQGTAPAIVAATVADDPAAYLQSTQFQFPLLAVYRLKARFSEKTINRWLRASTWGVDWIFPPLSAGQLRQLGRFFKAAEDVFMDRVSQGFDPAYLSGRQVWLAAGVQKIGLVSSERMSLAPRGPGAQATNSTFELLHLEFDVQEMSTPVAGAFEPLTGVDAHVEEADGLPVNDFAVNNP